MRQIEQEVIQLNDNAFKIQHRLLEIAQTKFNFDDTTTIECHSDKQASTLIETESFEKPIPNAMLFGFRYANYIGGEGNEPYGMKAWDLCQQLDDRKVPCFRL